MRFSRLLPVLTVFLIISCVTINIYFPADEVRGAADRIVDEVWGERAQDEAPAEPEQSPGSSFLNPLGAKTAHAAQNINVSTPEIRALRQSMKERSGALFPYLDSGQVGVGADGLLKIRSTDGLDLRARGEVTRLVKAENEDRLRLYKEIARANGFPDKVDEVRDIFAKTWRDKAAAGWYLENGGAWVQK